VLKSSTDLQLYDIKFHTEGGLTLKAFVSNTNATCTAVQRNSPVVEKLHGINFS